MYFSTIAIMVSCHLTYCHTDQISSIISENIYKIYETAADIVHLLGNFDRKFSILKLFFYAYKYHSADCPIFHDSSISNLLSMIVLTFKINSCLLYTLKVLEMMILYSVLFSTVSFKRSVFEIFFLVHNVVV